MRTMILLIILAASARAEVRYWIDSVEFRHDESSGTFTHNGETYGRISGGSYIIRSSDTVTGQKSEFITSVDVTPYLTSFPSASAIRNNIQTDAVSKGAKAYLDRTRAQGKVPAKIPKFTVSDIGTPGISTQTVTLP